MRAAVWFARMLTLGLTGCGNAIYVLRITQASDELGRAEQLDAARKAPYEYHFALEHLHKARTEAAEADFGDAIRLAEIAHVYARRAVQVGQRVEPAKPVAADSP
jgi:hypothetical protein